MSRGVRESPPFLRRAHAETVRTSAVERDRARDGPRRACSNVRRRTFSAARAVRSSAAGQFHGACRLLVRCKGWYRAKKMVAYPLSFIRAVRPWRVAEETGGLRTAGWAAPGARPTAGSSRSPDTLAPPCRDARRVGLARRGSERR